MLRISIQDGPDVATLKLEGKVIGPWASELNRVWSAFEPSLGIKKLCLDLCGVTFVDKSGAKALQKILRLTDAEVLADTPFTRYFAAESMRKVSRSNRKEG